MSLRENRHWNDTQFQEWWIRIGKRRRYFVINMDAFLLYREVDVLDCYSRDRSTAIEREFSKFRNKGSSALRRKPPIRVFPQKKKCYVAESWHSVFDRKDEMDGSVTAKCDNPIGIFEIKLDPKRASNCAASPLVYNGGLSGQKGNKKNPLDYPSFISTPNGGKEIPKDSSNKLLEKHWLNGDFTLCGHLFNIKLVLILIILLLVIVTGCILAILKRIADVESSSSSIGGQPSTPILLPTASITQPDGTSNSSEASAARPKDWYLITRKDWNAYETVATDVFYLQHPVKNVIIAHTAGTPCLTEVGCLEKMRSIQAWAVGNNNFDDIPYNFLVGGDGNAFEGLGWDIRGAHSKGYNSISIGIGFIGNFVYIRPTPQQFEALKRLLAWGVDIGKLDPDYRLLPHNLTHATLSPGRFVYEEIKTWPHFTEERFYTH